MYKDFQLPRHRCNHLSNIKYDAHGWLMKTEEYRRPIYWQTETSVLDDIHNFFALRS